MTVVAVPNERGPEIHEADPEQRADPCLLRGRLGLGSMPAFDGIAERSRPLQSTATEDIEREARCREGDVRVAHRSDDGTPGGTLGAAVSGAVGRGGNRHTLARKDIWRGATLVTTVARMTALVLAEPEASMRVFLEHQLRSDGFDVLALESTEKLPRSTDPDVLVLGDPDDLDWCRVPDCPVIVLGDADPQAKVRALERCDDYLSRPFLYEELVARIRAVLRRCPPRREVLDLGQLVVDRGARRVLARGRDVALSQKEFALLLKLAADPDRVFTREHLLRDLWGYAGFAPTRTVESHASRIRCKLEAAGLHGWVVNEWGVGYKLRPSA